MTGTGCDHQGIRIEAPAKLNLLLELKDKRADGYHELETLMVTLELSDLLEVFPAKQDQTTITCRFYAHNKINSSLRVILESEKNLVFQAARKLQEYTGVKRAAHILLHKRIPSEAGLGGGSSDAAAALLALNQCWNLGLSQVELQKLAAELGSDIPFFLAKSPWAICRGRGEIIQEVRSRSNLPVVVVKPATGLSTKEVYQLSTIPKEKHAATTLLEALETNNISLWGKRVYNALDVPGRQLNQELVQLHDILQQETGIVPQMTGSGSACFVLCSHFLQAQRLSQKLRGLGYTQTYATRTRSKVMVCETIT